MSNTFRPTYRQPSTEDMQQIERVKTVAEQLETLIKSSPAGRYQSLAMTALEESVMWAVKHITQG